MSDRMRVLGGSIQVGDYITTHKPTDTWWKVEAVAFDRVDTPGRQGANGLLVRRFAVVNKVGYRKEITDFPGTGRKLYRWIPAHERMA